MEHIWTIIRFIIDNLPTAVDHFIQGESEERQERFREAVVPAMLGSSLVMTISLLERLVTDIMALEPDSGVAPDPRIPTVGNLREWARYLDLDPTWYGWNELGNFIRLRHCFAHKFGRLLERHRPHIEAFHRQLEEGLIVSRLRLDAGREEEVVPVYYQIKDGEVILQHEARHYLRLLCVGFLELLQASGYSIE